MSKKNKQNDQNARSAIDRMKMESAGEVMGYETGVNATNVKKSGYKSINKMIADGEVEAENLGNATIDNDYNS